ncbi:tetratricopeptide repeat protein [Streptosporangium sp. NPDC048047]|uniref:tetratricopeptide repeat protein n=1 Tax=Streptosporangium sp. NPDC048047 TaxID=3155748 RepID=UPI003423179A
MPTHNARCAEEIRARAVAAHGGALPLAVLHDLARQIAACCGHSPLKSARLARGWTVAQAVAQLLQAGKAAGLPERGVEVRAWRRWENGQHPGADYQDRLARLFQSGPVQLGFAVDYTPHPPEGGGDRTNRRDALRLGAGALLAPMLGDAESEARELTRRSEETDLGPSSIAYLQQVIDDYGRNYSRYGAEELWQAARRDRRQVAELLGRRMTLSQRQELYVVAAWLSLALAWASDDRGDVRAALAYAADARHHAGEAGHAEAVAWGWDVEATTLLYDDQPVPALRAAQQGALLAPAGSAAQTRLTGQLARINARLGQAEAAGTALTLLRSQAERHEPYATGLYSADAVRAWGVAATSSLWLGRDEEARGFAKRAVEVYTAQPGLSPTRRAISTLDLGIACARLGEPEQAVEYGLQALATPRYASAIVTRGASLGAVLERAYPGAPLVTRFREEMSALQAPRGPVGELI